MNDEAGQLKQQSLLRLIASAVVYPVVVGVAWWVVPPSASFWSGVGICSIGVLHGLWTLGTVVKLGRERSADSYQDRLGNRQRTLSNLVEGLMIRLGEGIVAVTVGVIYLVVVW